MRLLGTLGGGFAVAFGIGWLCGFSYQTDWLAGLVLSSTIYLSLQIDEPYMLMLQSVPNALTHSKLPEWMKRRLRNTKSEVE
jgi:hypothetical protein